MIKKALAAVLILMLSFSTLTACLPSNNDDLIAQIQEEFGALVSDAAEVASIIASVLASGLDLGGIVGEFLTIMSDITSISLSGIGELSSTALNSVRDTINNLTGTLLSLKVRLETAIGINTAAMAASTTAAVIEPADSSAQILSELSEIKTAISELRSSIELLNSAEVLP